MSCVRRSAVGEIADVLWCVFNKGGYYVGVMTGE